MDQYFSLVSQLFPHSTLSVLVYLYHIYIRKGHVDNLFICSLSVDSNGHFCTYSSCAFSGIHIYYQTGVTCYLLLASTLRKAIKNRNKSCNR